MDREGSVFQVLEGVFYYVVGVAAMPLPYETLDNTGKDIVLARKHNSKELQVMKCNQFCLSRLRHTLVNWCRFCILEREK